MPSELGLPLEEENTSIKTLVAENAGYGKGCGPKTNADKVVWGTINAAPGADS